MYIICVLCSSVAASMFVASVREEGRPGNEVIHMSVNMKLIRRLAQPGSSCSTISYVVANRK